MTCAHGYPLATTAYCPECERIRDQAIQRLKANDGVSPRRLRQRKERLARAGRGRVA